MTREYRFSLIEPNIAGGLVGAARYYHEHQRWFCRLFLVMPDHLHAMLSFPADARISRVIGEWKRYTARKLCVLWQDNYFDHRLRHDREATETHDYILQPSGEGTLFGRSNLALAMEQHRNGLGEICLV